MTNIYLHPNATHQLARAVTRVSCDHCKEIIGAGDWYEKVRLTPTDERVACREHCAEILCTELNQ